MTPTPRLDEIEARLASPSGYAPTSDLYYLLTQVRALRAGLEKYGRHLPTCHLVVARCLEEVPRDKDCVGCSCGLTTALGRG